MMLEWERFCLKFPTMALAVAEKVLDYCPLYLVNFISLFRIFLTLISMVF